MTLINILGLTVGILCALFIFLWGDNERSYDTIHPESDRIYRVESIMNFEQPTLWTVTPDPLADCFKAEFPEVEESVIMKRGFNITVANLNNSFYENQFWFVSPSFFSVFYFPWSDTGAALLVENPFTVLISRSMAAKYFGKEDPNGKTLLVGGKYSYTIAGTFADYPENSHLKIDFLASFNTLRATGEPLGNWGRYDFDTYIRLRRGVDQATFGNKILHYIDTHSKGSATRLQLQKVVDIHLFSPSGDGSITRVRIITLIGMLILMIAFINFINISTSLAIRRRKEISIRKTVGASRGNLIRQIYFELGFLTGIAIVLSMILVVLLLPSFNNFTGKMIAAGAFLKPGVIGLFAGMILGAILLAGLYPALFLSSFKPAELLNRGSVTRSAQWVRKLLVVIQFTISVILILATLIISNQFRYMKNLDLGFTKENIMFIRIPGQDLKSMEVVVDKAAQLLGNHSCSVSRGIPANYRTFNHVSKWEDSTEESNLMVNEMTVDHQYFSLTNIQVVRGRGFFEGENPRNLIINEEAAARMGFKNPIGKWIDRGDERYEIIGVVRNFHFKPLKDLITPMFLFYSPAGAYLNIKFDPSTLSQTLPALEKVVKEVLPDRPFEYGFLDEAIDSYYAGDKKEAKVVALFSIIAILTSCLGILGLSAFLAQSRTREIGIRKTLGGSRSSILFLVVREVIVLVAISNVIGFVTGGLIIRKWLENYAYRIHPGVPDYGTALLLTILLAMTTISFHAFRAASVNPVDAIRVS